MNEVTGTEVMNADTNTAESGGAGKYIAIGVASAMLVVGAGLGYLFGNKRGLKNGEEVAKAKLDSAVTKVTDAVHAATGTAPETPAAK